MHFIVQAHYYIILDPRVLELRILHLWAPHLWMLHIQRMKRRLLGPYLPQQVQLEADTDDTTDRSSFKRQSAQAFSSDQSCAPRVTAFLCSTTSIVVLIHFMYCAR